MTQISNTLKKIRTALKELNISELDMNSAIAPKGTYILTVRNQDDGTTFNVIANDLRNNLFLSILLPIEYDELASDNIEKQRKTFEICNDFNTMCRNLKCFITDVKLGRMIFSSETRHDKSISSSSLKDEINHSVKSVNSAIGIFNELIKGK